jgi:hypothetical protein
VSVVDTVLDAVVVRDSSFRGYVSAYEAPLVQIVNDPAGVPSHAILRFAAFPESISVSTGVPGLVVALDSFRLQMVLDTLLAASDVEVAVHRVPFDVDSLDRFADLLPFFDDSTLLATLPLADTLEAGDTLAVVFEADALPTFEEDGRIAAVGVALRGLQRAFVDLRVLTTPPSLTRFAQVDSIQADTVPRSDTRTTDFRTSVFPEAPDPAPDTLVIGGAPSARAILRVDLPAAIADSTTIVRATLLLVPLAPAVGAPGDSFFVQAEALAADFGPKSPIVTNLTGRGRVRIGVGSTDTVRVDVTHIVQPWQADSTAPRALSLRVTPEAASRAELRFGSSRIAAARPALQLTYVPRLQL